MSIRASILSKCGIGLITLLLIGAGAWVTRAAWLPTAEQWRSKLMGGAATAASGEKAAHDEGHAGHDHDSHAGHDESSSLELSQQARQNIGLKVGKVAVSTFDRTIMVPAVIVERPGQTETRVAAPLTGVISKIHATSGESLRPGQPLFDLRLTHEDMVQAQVDFLKSVEELDIVKKDVARMQPAFDKGALLAKTFLDRKYEQDKLEASLRVQREALRLHGLSVEQLDSILAKRHLISSMTVIVPAPVSPQPSPGDQESASDDAPQSLRVVGDVGVEVGRLVTAGDPLCTLADFAELYIEGKAFERDAKWIAAAMEQHWPVTAMADSDDSASVELTDLAVFYVADRIDPQSRTLHFYVRLPNTRTRDEVSNNHRFINWRFKPGQRLQLRVPVEQWPKRIVLPAEAVVQEGPEAYVFQQNGDHFDRRPVHVEYRDLASVVIAQDGSLFPGDTVALTGAQQMQMALKNKAGGAPDPHAGHNH